MNLSINGTINFNGIEVKNIDKDGRVSYVISLAAKDIDFLGKKASEGEEVISIVLSGPYAKDTSIFYKNPDKSIEGVEGYDKTVISLNPFCVQDFDKIFENREDIEYVSKLVSNKEIEEKDSGNIVRIVIFMALF